MLAGLGAFCGVFSAFFKRATAAAAELAQVAVLSVTLLSCSRRARGQSPSQQQLPSPLQSSPATVADPVTEAYRVTVAEPLTVADPLTVAESVTITEPATMAEPATVAEPATFAELVTVAEPAYSNRIFTVAQQRRRSGLDRDWPYPRTLLQGALGDQVLEQRGARA